MLNRIIDFSIKNKLVIGIFTFALIIWGVYSVKKLPIDAVPDITNNQVQVITLSPSLAAQEVEQLISYPVEQTMSTIPQIQEVRSISRFGLSVVTVIFNDDADIYWARQQVAERLTEARNNIPEGAGEPEMSPISTGLGEIYQYTVHPQKGFEDKFDAMALRTIQDWYVRRQLLGTPGIAEVNSFGGYLKQYEIAINIDQTRSYNVSIADIFTALEKNNQNTGGSYIDKKPNAYFIRSEGLINNLSDIERIVIKKTSSNIPITIRDIATVRYGSANRYGALTWNNKEAVGGIVMMLKGSNSSQVVARVKEKIAQIQKSLPQGVVIEPFLDRSEFVGRAIDTVKKNLIEGALIVILVLVIFLGNIRSGLIVASVIPLAMLFAIALMNVFGVSGNLMSLGAIDFGLIVDGAVIIVEATMHHLISRRESKLTQEQMDEEVGDSAKKMMNSAAFGQIIILIVYLPILALVGIEGKMFRPMAQTVSFAILGAFILSLTYIPMMSSLFLSKKISKKKNLSDRMMDRVQRFYAPILAKALKIRKTIVVIAVVMLAAAIYLFGFLGGEFLPQLEEGDFAVETRLLTGSSLTQTIDKVQQASNILMKQFPEVKEVVGKIGASEIPTDPMPIEACDLTIILKPKKEWTTAHNREELAEKMKTALETNVPGVSFGFSQPIQLRFNELISGVRQDVGIKIFGEDMQVLAEMAKKISTIVPTVKGAEDMYLEQVGGLPQISIKLNRERIAQYGLNVIDINNTINSAFAGGKAGTVFEGEKRFDLVIRLQQTERQGIEDVKRLYVTASDGNQIPLEQVADISLVLGPNQIQREQAQRRIIVGFNVRGRDIASVVQEIQGKIEQSITMPPGYYISYGGQFKNLEEANKRLSVAVPVALGLILLLLYFTFGSFKYSILIFTAIPMSAIGGVFALWIRGMPFSISAGVGFIALFGVAVLNGIVLITEFNRLKKQGLTDIRQIIMEGTAVRLRPVLMTASVASLGFLPMAISTGAGGEVQKPLATVVIGGLLTATLLTLIVLPILYSFFEAWGSKKKAKLAEISKPLMLLVLAVGLSAVTMAQTPTSNAVTKPGGTINLNQALSSSIAVNPNIRAGNLGVAYQQALRGASKDIGKTNISLMYGQYNSPIPYDNNITISQSIPNPVYLKRLTELADASVDASRLQIKIYQTQVSYQVKGLYYRLMYRSEQERLADSLIQLYQSVLRAANLRFTAGETNILETYNTNTQLQEAIAQKMQLDEQIRADLQQLSRFVGDSTITGISDTLLVEKKVTFATDSAAFSNNPEIQALRGQLEIASKEIAVERSKLLPDFTVGYFNQSLVGNYDKNGVTQYYGVGHRFQGIEAGISIPLFAKPQKARIRAAELNRERRDAEVQAFYFTLSQRGLLLLSEIKRLNIQLDYYRRTALPQADLLIRTSRRAFEAGEMDYYQLSQSLNNANNVKRQYIESLNLYNQSVIELELIIGL